MYFQLLNFTLCFSAVFGQLFLFLQAFSHFEGKMPPQAHIKPYLPFLITEIPQRWLIFCVLPMNKLCTQLPGSFCTDLVSTGFSVIWKKNDDKIHVGPYVAFPTIIFDALPMADFVSCFLTVFGQVLWFLKAFLSFGRTHSLQNTY